MGRSLWGETPHGTEWGHNPAASRTEGCYRPQRGHLWADLVLPLFADVQVPLPGEVIGFIVVSEERLHIVTGSGQQTPGGFLYRSEKLIFIHTGTVTSNHVVGLVH